MEFLEQVAQSYKTGGSMQDQVIRSLAIKSFAPYIPQSARGLELGCDDGYMTSLIAPLVTQLSVVDGSRHFIEMAKARSLPNVDFTHSLFENFTPTKRFDCIFATYVLEHVHDAVVLLKHIRALLSEDGRLFVVVPNARAMSRQLARHMGLLDNLFALTTNDHDHGHRRVYDRALLSRDIASAGLEQVAQGGLLFKPLADFQMNLLMEQKILGSAQIDGLYRMGLEYPDFAGSMFSICKNPSPGS